MASCSTRMDDVEGDFSIDNLYKETMGVVEIYKKQTFKACRAKINELGDTALHLAVSMAPEDIVEELVLIISQFDKNGLRMINKKGNTILHVASSTSKVRTCICIAEADRSLGDVRNNDGESPLFLAAFHDLAFKMLHLDPSLAYSVNEGGITPMHLIACKPSAFRSACHLQWWEKIIYYCKYYSIFKLQITCFY
ncbi:ankyrin repeat-containing protein bda1 [Quercus suber]|uniref:Ankyrin repeat-containing protein bda1 n=1 Tax=Quercus suber TaxID=58331 RepID=A0AAW0KMQ2_QUESU